MASKGICFVISPIGEPGSNVRRQSDQILKYIIAPAVQQCGFSAVRADQIADPGIITSQVVKHIIEDPLVVADLTGRSPNVFYELAIRHAVRKPLVHIIAKGEPVPFDIASIRTIQVDHQDLDSVSEAKDQIARQIRVTETDDVPLDNPISVAVDVQQLLQSRKSEQRVLAELVSAVSEVRSSMLSIEERIRSPASLLPQPYLKQLLRSSTSAEAKAARTAAELRQVCQDLMVDLSRYVKTKRGQDRLARIAEYIEHIANTLVS